jgi:prepilin-type N-terminal cleavage/methylation domain-containing protein
MSRFSQSPLNDLERHRNCEPCYRPGLLRQLHTRPFLHASTRGFTLIELMIVVAIIGILAVVSLTSFTAFQTRAKQAEAKLNLGGIGTAAQSYFVEKDTYQTSFSSLGWAPNTATRYRFWYFGQFYPGTPSTPEAGVSYADPGSAAASTTFVTAAVGNIDTDTSTDQWTYTESRILTNTQSDVTTP